MEQNAIRIGSIVTTGFGRIRTFVRDLDTDTMLKRSMLRNVKTMNQSAF